MSKLNFVFFVSLAIILTGCADPEPRSEVAPVVLEGRVTEKIVRPKPNPPRWVRNVRQDEMTDIRRAYAGLKSDNHSSRQSPALWLSRICPWDEFPEGGELELILNWPEGAMVLPSGFSYSVNAEFRVDKNPMMRVNGRSNLLGTSLTFSDIEDFGKDILIGNRLVVRTVDRAESAFVLATFEIKGLGEEVDWLKDAACNK